MRINECPHPDRQYFAKGMCKPCYYAAYDARPENKDKQRERRAQSENKDYHRKYHTAYRANNKDAINAYMKAYRARPEVRARMEVYRARNRDAIKAQQAAYQARPEAKARLFLRNRGIAYESVLPWFVNPDRTCWMCHQAGATHLDHDHRTLVIRGWTHRVCNIAEGSVMASPDPIATAAALLQIALGA